MSVGTCLFVALAAGAARAHEVGLSRGVYTPAGRDIVAEVTLARGELRDLAPELDRDGDGALADAELAEGTGVLQVRLGAGVELLADGQACVGALERAALTEEDGARVVLRHVCPAPPRVVTLRLPVLAALAFGHRHLGQFVGPDGQVFADVVLHRGAPEASVELPAGGEPVAPPAPPVGAYFRLGVEHILIGVDHLVFLLGLVVVGGRLRSLLAVITAFTLGHSLSLALATLGVWTPDAGFVEPAIALSIAYVGAENFLVADAAGRWRLTLPFGFVHGFGFAGVLAEIGVPQDAVGAALLLFNLGVEAGQLLVLLVVLPLLAWLGGRAWYRRVRGPRWISAAIVVAGLYWFVERTLLAG